MGTKKISTSLIREDLMVDVEYGDRTKGEVIIWMMLLALEYLRIAKTEGNVDLYYNMCYSRIYRKW
jgi:hypothetical protein